ncbi:MAG: BNR-repeat neuraminidase N-terminal domain-containing protein [Pirellulaceae bacterium]|nr:BNR-repeat neuraminidase N-terminal domain-containing protein [Pirellulaceae bacterium]
MKSNQFQMVPVTRSSDCVPFHQSTLLRLLQNVSLPKCLLPRSLVFLAVCAFVCAGLEQTGAAQDHGLVANVMRPAHPLLIRNQHGPALRITLDVSKGQSARLVSMEFSFESTDGLNDIDTIQLFATGDQEAFSPLAPIGEAVAPARSIIVPLERQLTEGRNVFWLSCRLKETADLQHEVSATCSLIKTSVGNVTPRQDFANAKQRIGIALRKHQDDGVHTYRIPALTTSTKGTLLAVYDIRRRDGRDLQEDIDIGLSRSTDGGQTWESPRVIMDMGTYGGMPQEQNGCSDPGLIVDQQSGEIFCFALWMNGKPGHHQWVNDGSEPGFEIGKSAQFMMVRSNDDGQTWSAPENLKD